MQKGAATFLEDNLRQTSVFSSDSEDVQGDDKVSDHILYSHSSHKTSSASSVATQVFTNYSLAYISYLYESEICLLMLNKSESNCSLYN